MNPLMGQSLKDKQSVTSLIGFLDNDSEEIVAAAAQALGEIKDERAVDPLRRIQAKYIAIHPTTEEGYNESCIPTVGVALNKLKTVEVLLRLLRDGDGNLAHRANGAIGDYDFRRRAVQPGHGFPDLGPDASPIRGTSGIA